MSRKLEIYLDMDDTLVDFAKGLDEKYLEKFGQVREPSLSWDLPKEVCEIFHADGFFASLKPIDGATRFVERLVHDEFDVYIVTDAQGRANASAEKIEWVKEYFPFFPTKRLFIMSEKFKLAKPNALLIDDGPHHVEGWMEHGGITICMDTTYNKDVEAHFRCKNKDFDYLYSAIHWLERFFVLKSSLNFTIDKR